jgi:Ethylbenzene dehydrogenase/Prokaryotic cytochrome b561
MRRRKTDYGTIILHWLLVVAFGVAFVTGMRIATEAPERIWINSFDAVLPQNVWVMHMQAAVVLLAVAFAYTIYMRRSGLGRRIRLDKVRLRGLVGRGQARRGAVNIVLYWVFFVAMLALMASGGLMYFGYFAGYDVLTLHWYATWVVLGFAGLHVLSHLRIGGTSQLLRILRPTGLSAPPPQLDAIELLSLLAEQSARLQPESGGAETASETRMQPVQRAAPVRPVQRETRVQPVRREAPLQPVQREVRVQPPVRREAPVPPVQREARVQLVRREAPVPPVQREARVQLVRREAPLQPVQRETRVRPVQREALLQPVQRETRVRPVQREALLQPIQREAPLQPVQRDALLQPIQREAPLQPTQRPKDAPRGRPPVRNAATHPAPEPAAKSRTSKPRSPTFQSNPFVVAAAIAIAGASIVVATDRMAVDQLQIHRISSADAPILDGDTSDRAWRNIQPFSVMTNQGGNFDGKGESRIDIRAVHDGTWAYFLFTWEDPTRSLKHLPLIKEIDGWHMLHNGYEIGDEHDYNEDKFSVLLTTLDVTLAGDRTFHAGPHPLPEAPATMTGRGLHYTPGNDVYVDVWLWKATSSGSTGWMDDAHFGPPLDPTPMQVRNAVPYRGGFAPDPGTANYADNFIMTDEPVVDGKRMITPRRLPRDLAKTTAAMGEIDLDPNHGESDGARWFMTEAESVPYSSQQDATVPVGTVIPGVVIGGEFSGDRADIRCAARWASGHWALEVARRLDTHSQYDVPLQTGVFMRVAAFDHSQIRHTRHVRPIRLEVE